jgi:hypothetical protein
LLLLDTARLAPQDARLFEVAAAWLSTYYELVAPHRLLRLLRDQGEPQLKPVLGLLLNLVGQRQKTGHFRGVIAQCRPEPEGKPLYEFQQRNPRLRAIARNKASAISKRWGLWVEDFPLKTDAIRPAPWVLRHNPALAWRERFEGDLRACIVETLQRDTSAGRSESQLARACHASRDALRQALDRLSRYGYVAKVRRGRASEVRLCA